MSCHEEPPVATVVNGQEAIKVYRDEIEDSPREWDNLGVISMHSKSAYSGLGEEEYDTHGCAYDSDEPGKCGAELFDGALAVLPLFVDDWGWKLVMRTARNHENEPPSGYIYATRERAEAMWCTTRRNAPSAKKARDMLRDEIASYNQFLAGEVYEARHVRAEKCDKGHEHEETVESLHGYYPAYDGNLDEDGRCAYRYPVVLATTNPADEVVRQYIDDWLALEDNDPAGDGKRAMGWYKAAAECGDLSEEARDYWAGMAGKAARRAAAAGAGGGGS